MGRQAYLNRLAFGLSAFGPPERDEHGNFIIGAPKRDGVRSDYIQDFAERGHPQNPNAESSARRLRRAQNEVLATVGVVVRREQDKKNRWQKMTDYEKGEIVADENHWKYMILTPASRLPAFCATWWIQSLRYRLVTYGSASQPLVLEVINDFRELGLGGFFFPGFGSGLASVASQFLRYLVVVEDSTDTYVDMTRPGKSISAYKKLLFRDHRPNITWFCIEFSLRSYAMLQASRLLTTSHNPGFWNAMQAIWSPNMSRVNNIRDISLALPTSAAADLLLHPFILSCLYDFTSHQLHHRLHVLFRRMLPKPDQPCRYSIEVGDRFVERNDLDSHEVDGLGIDVGVAGRFYGPKTWRDCAKVAFAPISDLLDWIRGRESSVRKLSFPEVYREEILRTARSRFITARSQLGEVGNYDTSGDRKLCREVLTMTFREYNMLFALEVPNPEEWIEALLFPLKNEAAVIADDGTDDENGGDLAVITMQPTNDGGTEQGANEPDLLLLISDEANTLSADNTSVVEQREQDEQGANLETDEVQEPELWVLGNNEGGSLSTDDNAIAATPELEQTQDTEASSPATVRSPRLDLLTQPTSIAIPINTVFGNIPATLEEIPRVESQEEGRETSLHPPSPTTTPSGPPPVPSPDPAPTPTQPGPEIPSTPPDQPSTPEPGLRRAGSLGPIPVLSPPLRRPFNRRQRRLTETYGTEEHVDGHLPGADLATDEDVVAAPVETDKILYRVTLLSNHAADLLANQAAYMIVNILMLPLEALILRQLIRSCVRRGIGELPIISTANMGILHHISTMGAVGFNHDLLRYCSDIGLTYGIEALIRLTIWGTSTAFSIYEGRRHGWGEFSAQAVLIELE